MSEAVVPRPAEVLAALAEVVAGAGDPVLVDHHRVVAAVLVLDPLGPDVEPALGRQPRDDDSLDRARSCVSARATQ